jgi:uncharacterized membrane protein YbhN (UPF0104 family)
MDRFFTGPRARPAKLGPVVTLSPAPGHRRERRSPNGRSGRLLLWVSIGFAALVGGLIALEGPELAAAIADVPAWALIGAVLAQLTWLVCRGEAWRLALNAIGPREVRRTSAHVANALAFGVGALQSLATVPARALALRRLAPDGSPTLEQTLVADAPVLTVEAALMALVLLVAVAMTPALPTWGAAAAFAAAVLALLALVLVRDRLRGRGLATGLRVLADRRRRVKLVVLAATMSAVALSRSWFVLAGFDLPHGFASVAIFIAALGIAASLPIGLASTPAAALAIFGATDPTRATAAGLGMVASSLLAVAAYGTIALGFTAVASRRRERASAAESSGPPRRSMGRAA